MSFKLTAHVYASKQKFTGTQKSILAYLAFKTNEDTGQCNPSIRTIQKETGFSKSVVQENLQKLKQNGFILTSQSKNISTQYFIVIDRVLSVDKPANNSCIQKNAVSAAGMGGVSAASTPVCRQPVQNGILNGNIENYNKGPENCGQFEHAQWLLISLGWYKSDAKHYINYFGTDLVLSEIRKARELTLSGKIKERFMGIEIRKALEKIDIGVKYKKK